MRSQTMPPASGRQPGSIGSILVPIHKDGYKFIAIFAAVAVVLGMIWDPLFWLGVVATAWCAFFFRDPERVTPLGEGLVTSPADGVVCFTGPRVPPPEMGLSDEPLPCVGIFMNVFDVHVNRTPVPGVVERSAYHHGKFLNASMDKASDENERRSWLLRSPKGAKIGLVQIAGLVARRIVEPFVPEGETLQPGQRIGLIRFGSRCDVYLPHGVEPKVIPGQRAFAGETVLADLDGPQAPAIGRAG